MCDDGAGVTPGGDGGGWRRGRGDSSWGADCLATLAGDSPQGRVHTHLRTGGGGEDTPPVRQAAWLPPGPGSGAGAGHPGESTPRWHRGRGRPSSRAWAPPPPHHLRHPPKPPVEGAWRGAGCTERRDCPQNHLPFIRHRSRVQTPRLSRGGVGLWWRQGSGRTSGVPPAHRSPEGPVSTLAPMGSHGRQRLCADCPSRAHRPACARACGSGSVAALAPGGGGPGSPGGHCSL